MKPPAAGRNTLPSRAAPSRLPGYLAASYALLTVYACLHPFAGWRDTGVPPLAFLSAPWPKYFDINDVWLNVLGYMPLGFTLAAALRGHRYRLVAWLEVLFVSSVLSFAMEFLQNYLPTRVSSNMDLATNILGGLIGGGMGFYWGGIFERNGALDRWRERHIQSGHIGEIGLILVALWWLTQLEPSATLFGIGDLRPLFDLPAPMAFSAKRFVMVEAVIVGCNTLALGLVVMRCLRASRIVISLGVVIVGLLLRALADSLFIVPADPLHWLTPGAKLGLLAGVVMLMLVVRLSRGAQHSLAALILLLGTALVNLAPENPFQMASMRLIQEGHFLNFNGLTRLTSSLWPFCALAYLTAQGALRAGRHPRHD